MRERLTASFVVLSILLLLGAGFVIMFLLYTGWGLWEINSLPVSALP